MDRKRDGGKKGGDLKRGWERRLKGREGWGGAKDPVTGIVQRRCPRQGCLAEMP